MSHFRIYFLLTALIAVPISLEAQPQTTSAPVAPTAQSSDLRDGQHDFDFEIGTWRTHLRRLDHPLTGSKTWVEYDGTTTVRKVWDGRANLVELEADGSAGHIEALSLRLYNPDSHQWSLNFSSSDTGTLSQPTIGDFKNGHGEFYDQEMLNGRAIFVRFVISHITRRSCRFEQSFSSDGGRTWELNWVAEDTRIGRGHGSATAPDSDSPAIQCINCGGGSTVQSSH